MIININTLKYLKDIFNSEKKDIVKLYIFDFADIIYNCIQPFLIGKAIDDLLRNNFLWVIVLVVTYLINVLIEYINNIDDDIIYNRIKFNYRKKYYCNALNKSVSTSTIDANIELVDEVIEFVRCLVANYLESVCMLCAAMIFICKNFGFQIQVIVFSVCLILIFIGIITNKKQVKNLYALYDINEKRRIKIGSRDLDTYSSFLSKRYHLIISNSKIDARGTLTISIIRILVLSVSLFLYSREQAISVGIIYAGIEYIIMLMDGFDAIPRLYYDYKDISICVDKIDLYK